MCSLIFLEGWCQKMTKMKKCLREGRYDDLANYGVVLAAIPLALLVLLIGWIIRIGLQGQYSTIRELGLDFLWSFGMSYEVLSLLVLMEYQERRDQCFFLADLPLDRTLGRLMLIMLLGVFPVMIVSAIQMRRTEYNYQQADIQRRLEHEELVKQHLHQAKKKRFPPQLRLLLRDYCVTQQQVGRAQLHEEMVNEHLKQYLCDNEYRIERLGQLAQSYIEQKEQQTQSGDDAPVISDKLAQDLIDALGRSSCLQQDWECRLAELQPSLTVDSGKFQSSAEECLDRLKDIPGILGVDYKIDCDKKLWFLSVCVQIADCDDDPCYNLGVYSLVFDAHSYHCRELHSGLTTNGVAYRQNHCDRIFRDDGFVHFSDNDQTRVLFTDNDPVSRLMRQGLLPQAVSQLIEKIRKQQYEIMAGHQLDADEADDEIWSRYFLPLAPLRDR